MMRRRGRETTALLKGSHQRVKFGSRGPDPLIFFAASEQIPRLCRWFKQATAAARDCTLKKPKNPFGPSNAAGAQTQRDPLRRWMRTNNHSEGTLKRSRGAAAGAAAVNRRGAAGAAWVAASEARS